MVAPVLPQQAFAALRAVSVAGLRHSGRRWVEKTIRYPNGEESTSTVLGDPFPCRLHAVGEKLAAIAAAQGVKAQWSLVMALGEDVAIKQHVVVSGETDGAEWTREVEITADLGLTGRIHRQTTAVDVELNQ